jgi:acetyl esterase/lipase
MKYSLLVLALALQDAGVKEKRDLAYYDGKDADAKKHKLDLFLPDTDKPFPVLMWIHGGAWKLGDRALYSELGRRFAESGIGCAVISYRLSPAVKHPEHVKDCARAFAWLTKNIREHGGRPDRLFVCGQSAGGHLTALLTLNRKYLKELDVPDDAVKGAIPMSGIYAIPAVERDVPGLKMFKDAFGSDPDVCKDASPTHFVKNATFPMLVLTEEHDDFGGVRESTALFRKAVSDAEVKTVTFVDAKDRNHFSIVTQMMRKGDDPQRAAIVEFIRKRCAELDK